MHALQNKRINTKRYLRKGQRQQSAEEKKKGEGEEKKARKRRKRDFGALLSHTCMRAHSNRNIVFLLSQVSHDGGKFDRKVRKLGEIEEKTTRKNVFFSVVQSPFWTIISSVC